VTRDGPASVRDLDVQEIVILNLQRAVQSSIDLAAHFIASKDWGIPDSLKQHFAILEQHNVIDSDLSTRLRAMIGFRNVAIHEYQSIDIAILENIVARRLSDLEAFADAIRIAAV